MRRLLVGLAGAAMLMTATSAGALAGVRQAGGASTVTSDTYNTGVRSQISAVRLPQYASDNATHYFWTGEFLRDGSAYQAGTAVNYAGCGSSCWTFFAQAFDFNGNRVLAWPPVGTLFGTNANHMVGFMATYVNSTTTDWWAAFDGVRYANTDYYVNAPDSGPYVPSDISETSVNGPVQPNPNDDMGYANFFSPAMQTFDQANGAWRDTISAQIVYPFGDNQYCPPINVVPSSYQVFSAGAPLGRYPCGAPGALLW